MSRTIPVLINRSGGTAAAMGDGLVSAIEDAFAATGRKIAIELVDGCDMFQAAEAHAGKALVVVGGGDGTIGAAASALAQSPSALAVLPLGTRNHFARQLGVPLDLGAAAKLALTGQRRRIDLGSAGSRVFVNNASFGIYTRFVRQRDHGDGPKWRGAIAASWHALRRMRSQRFALQVDGENAEVTTPLLFVGNNEYSISLGHLGERERLSDGRLSICAVSARRPLQLLTFMARTLIGLARSDRDFEAFGSARQLVIEGNGYIEGAFDGELVLLPLPLQLRSLPGALGVVTPWETVPAEGALLPSESRSL